MSLLPKRPSLVDEVADVIREGVRARRWVDHLPGERSLCRQLGVSRRTLQKAFQLLERDRLFGPGRGRRRLIVAMPGRGSTGDLPPVLGVVSGVPELRSHAGFVSSHLEQIRDWAHRLGMSVQVHSMKPYLIPRPQARLEMLLRESPARCWLLSATPEIVGRWFMERGLPTVLIGRCYPGIELPAVDVNYYAICRHAVGAFMRLGHRRIAFMMHRWKFAGDVDSERGFREGCAAGGLDAADSVVVEHDGTPRHIVQVVNQLIGRPRRPTAILTMGSKYTITAATHLLNSGIRIPQHISLISRDEDDHLHTVIPRIVCYESLYGRIARRVFQVIAQLTETGYAPPRQVSLMPELQAGDSLAAPPS